MQLHLTCVSRIVHLLYLEIRNNFISKLTSYVSLIGMTLKTSRILVNTAASRDARFIGVRNNHETTRLVNVS